MAYPVIPDVPGNVFADPVTPSQKVNVKAARTSPALADDALVTALSPNNTGLPVNLPVIVQKAKNVTAADSTTVAKAFASNVTAGNTIVVQCGAGNNGTLTVTDTLGNTYTSAVVKANSTTFEAQIFYSPGIVGGANTVTVTNGGAAASMALEIYEVSGLLAAVSSLESINSGTGTSATPNIGQVASSSPNSLAFTCVAVGTAAQAASVTAGTSWTLDSTQNSGGTPTGLFTFGSFSQLVTDQLPVLPTVTIASSEPFAMVAAIFKPVTMGIQGTVTIGGYNYTRVTSAATTLVKTGPGILHAIVVNKPTSTATIEADDALTNTTPIIGILGAFAASIAPFTVVYDVAFTTGLSVTVGVATVDATIVWK